MDSLFQSAFLRAKELNDEALLLYFLREVERQTRAAEAGKRGGRPRKPRGLEKEKNISQTCL
jgi:hypothetical protein